MSISYIANNRLYQPYHIKWPLFGDTADTELQAKFRVVKVRGTTLTDSEVQSRVADAVEEFFDIDNWDFGETFYFSELATYVINQLSPDVVSIVLVPKQETQSFGSLYEIKSENDEVLISSAKVDDIEIIDGITASRLKASGLVITSDDVLNVGVQSSSNTSIAYTSGTSSSSSGSSDGGSGY